MAEEDKKQLAKRNDVGSQVIARVDELCSVGFTMPTDYNYVNAIKATMLVLQDLKDRNKQPALKTCTPVSVQSALFKMAQKGLDVSKNQGYFIVRGNQLCFDEGYFGRILQVKRIFPNFSPQPRVIYQGDVFKYETDPETGRRKLVEHEQELENIDKDFVGAYMYLPCADGGQDLYLMTRQQIMTAWQQSPNGSLSVHKKFTEKMVCKTIINSGCNTIINSTPDGAQMSESEYSTNAEFASSEPLETEYEEIDMDNAETTDTVDVQQPQAEGVETTVDDEDF
jgi:recombination protein RecT